MATDPACSRSTPRLLRSPGPRRLPLLLVVAALAAPARAQPGGEEKTGQVQQPIVSSQLADAAEQESAGVVTISRRGFTPHCSGVLVSNLWVLTAAHCVEAATGVDRADPATIVVGAGWRAAAGTPREGMQSAAGAAVYTFWGDRARTAPPPASYDVALVRLATPIRVGGQPTGWRVAIAPGSAHDLAGRQVRAFGRGISRYAFIDANGMAQPTASDGRWRVANFTVSGLHAGGSDALVPPGGFANLARYTTSDTNSVAGGDSGGPSFVVDGGKLAGLAGVHALCGGGCLTGPGRQCTAADPWTWATAPAWCGDAPLAPAASAIEDLMTQAWDPRQPYQAIEVAHSEGDIDKSMRLGRLDGLRWAYVQRAVQSMCINRGFVAGIATGAHQPGRSYRIVCFSAQAGRLNAVSGTAPRWSFADADQVDWAQANRSAADLCAQSPGSPGGFHTGFSQPGSGLFAPTAGLFCLNGEAAAWLDQSAARLGAAADVGNPNWAAAYRAAAAQCAIRGRTAGAFLNGHQAPGLRGSVCLGEPVLVSRIPRIPRPSP